MDLRKPALSSPVMLDVAKTPAAGRGESEVELLHVLVVCERTRRAIHDDAAVLEDEAVARMAQRDHRVLLGEQERHALVAIQLADDREDLLDDLRREAHR